MQLDNVNAGKLRQLTIFPENPEPGIPGTILEMLSTEQVFHAPIDQRSDSSGTGQVQVHGDALHCAGHQCCQMNWTNYHQGRYYLQSY